MTDPTRNRCEYHNRAQQTLAHRDRIENTIRRMKASSDPVIQALAEVARSSEANEKLVMRNWPDTWAAFGEEGSE